MAGHTEVWRLTRDTKWPFRFTIVDVNGKEILTQEPIAWSSSSDTLEDLRSAKGFKGKERNEVVAALAEQERHMRLIAAAPDLLKALEGLLGTLGPILENMPLSAMGAIGKTNLDALGWAVKFGCEAIAAARGRQG